MSTSPPPFPSSSFDLLAEAESKHWWFRARNRILLWAFNSKIKSFRSFLEIGCGTGYVLSGIHKRYPDVELVGAEYFEEGIVFARKRIPSATFKQLDAVTMNELNRYDVVGAFDVLEHIEHDEKVLDNLAGAIKPGGHLIVTVPQHRWLWSIADEYACHLRRYTRREIIDKVERANLRVCYISSFVSLLVPAMWFSRSRAPRTNYDPMSEFKIPRWLNNSLETVMRIELALLKIGLRFPIGGSLLLVAKKNP